MAVWGFSGRTGRIFLSGTGVEAVAPLLPCFDAPLQGAHPQDAIFLQHQRHTGTARFVRSGAVHDHLLALGDFVAAILDIVGGQQHGAGNYVGKARDIKRVPQINHQRFGA